MLLIYLTLAWVAGLLWAERYAPHTIWGVALALFGLVGAWFFRADKPFRLVPALILAFGLGLFRFDLSAPQQNLDHVSRLNDRGQLTLRGIVVSAPTPHEGFLRFHVAAEEAGGQRVKGRVLVSVPRYSTVAYGDRVQVFGWLRTPPTFDTFSYADALARAGVFSAMFNADFVNLAPADPPPPYARLLMARNRAADFIKEQLPDPYGALMVGMVLGDESGLSSDVEAAFARTGTAHLIAISGFNMVILAGTVMALLRLVLARGWAAAVGILILGLYTLLVGASPSVVRAALMTSLLLIGQAFRRQTYLPTSVAVSAFLMSLLQPNVLWDVGFQLSLAAVLGLAVFSPILNRWLKKTLEKQRLPSQGRRVLLSVGESLNVTLAAQIATTPLIAFYFGRFSLVSLPVNLILTPLQTPLLLLGAGGTLLGLLFPPVGAFLLQGAGLLMQLSWGVIRTFSALSWADTALSFSAVEAWAFFLSLGAFIWLGAVQPTWMPRQKQVLHRAALVLAALCLLIAGLLWRDLSQRPDGRLHVTFLDMEGENAVLVQSPKGAAFLIDGGRLPNRLLSALGQKLPNRKRTLEAIFITSPSEANITALPAVLKRYQVGVVLSPPSEAAHPAYLALQTEVQAQNIPLPPLSAGYTLETDDGLRMEILSPALAETAPKLVVRLTYGQSVFLFTGDLRAEEEAQLLAQPHLLQATVLQVGKHGSGSSSGMDFIRVVAPQVAIIQVNPVIHLDAPSPTVLERLAESRLWRSDQHGHIHLWTDGQALWIRPQNGG